MRHIFSWSTWSIATKILVPFLSIAVIAISVFAYITFSDISDLGDYALETSTDLGESAIEDSTAHLTALGEEIITQKAADVAVQVGMYLAGRLPMTVDEMRSDPALRDIVVQTVGETGYTTLIDPSNAVILVHRFPGQEKDISPLSELLPSFWQLIEDSAGGDVTAGYYDWLEVDGRITEKYAAIAPVVYGGDEILTLWATTYIEEFSQPVAATRQGISEAIAESERIIRDSVNDTQRAFIISFVVIFFVVTVLALLLSRAITRPILSLKKGAAEIGFGKLDYRLDIGSRDELGDLARSFNTMAADLRTYVDKLEQTAAENIAKEKTIQDNLRTYALKVSQAQENERKRIARELHDDTVQALVAVTRNLEALAEGTSDMSADDIREQVRELTRGVRRFSQELRPSVLDDLGLIPALKWLANDLAQNYGVHVDMITKGSPLQLSPEVELILFRIVQESLSNVRKHSGATEANVTVRFSDTQLVVTVEDNGRGFSISAVEELATAGKLGLLGIKERAELLGGTFDIKSGPGRGTTLVVTLPIDRGQDVAQ